MKKKNIINLIRYHVDKNEIAFRKEAEEIAEDFESIGDYQLSEYIMALMTNTNTFVPQMYEDGSSYLEKVQLNTEPLPLPEIIEKDIIGIINAISNNIGVNKFLFYGMSGTGKTETAKQIARILKRDLFIVNFTSIIDCKLGQTQKNITNLFEEINKCDYPSKMIVLFDEIDAIALDRLNNNDLREMGRATSTLLRGFDCLNENITIIATTNLYENFDKALLRRFDAKISFDRYKKEDLEEIAVRLFEFYNLKYRVLGRNIRLLKKVVKLMPTTISPGELKNIIKTSMAFSNKNDEFDYIKRIYSNIVNKELSICQLQKLNFTVREIEILTGISKSEVSRQLREIKDE